MMTPEAIAALRKKLGLSQRAFGELLHVTDSIVSYWEAGLRHPSYKRMVILNELAESRAVNGRKKVGAK